MAEEVPVLAGLVAEAVVAWAVATAALLISTLLLWYPGQFRKK